MKNNRKTLITLLLAFAVALASVCAGSSATCLVAKKKTVYKKATKAYQEFISKDIKKMEHLLTKIRRNMQLWM